MSKQIPPTGTATAIVAGAPNTLQTSFYSELEAKANQVAGNLFKVRITPISAGSLGGFNYIWHNENQEFNQATYDFIDSRVMTGTPATLSTRLSTDYDTLLRRIAFHYSKSDEQIKNKEAADTSLQAGAVVTQYTSKYGPITPAMLETASVLTSIDYIILHVLARQWSGRAAAMQPPLTIRDLLEARDLSDLLPMIPPSGLNLLPTIASYLSRAAGGLPLIEMASNRNSMKSSLIRNTEVPTTTNGGITTVSAKDGTRAVRVGYAISAATTAIQNDLDDGGRTIEVDMRATQSSAGTVSVSVGTAAAVSVPANWFLTMNAANQAHFDLYSVNGAGSDVSIRVEFKGYSWVPIAVAQYQQDTNTGWMNPQVLKEAADNRGKDETGLAFVGDPGFNLGEGGDFGLLTGVLISNAPTFTITYENGDYSKFQQGFQQNAAWSASFLGIALGSFGTGSYQATVQQNATGGGFSVTFGPSPELLTVPDLQKQAYVIGGSVAYPGTGNLR